MGTSLFLAKWIGVAMTLISLGVLLNREHFTEVAERARQNPLFLLLAGVLRTVVGAGILVTHNVWVVGWPVLITLFGWLMLLSGGLYLLFPHYFHDWLDQFSAKRLYPALPTVSLLVGIFLAAVGFLGG